MQVLFAYLQADHVILLFLPEYLTACTLKADQVGVGSPNDSQLQLFTGGVQHTAKMHDNKICGRRANSQDTSTHNITAVLQSSTMYMEKAIMQATMLYAYQAHQFTRHHSKISVLSSMGLHHDKLCREAPQYGTTYNTMLRNGCRAVLVAMHKTLYMESRDICGPTILCYPPGLPLDMHVCL